MTQVEKVTKRFDFFRDVQLYPMANTLDFESWLANFESSEDKELAAQVLTNFIYIPEPIEIQMLKTVVGKCGFYFKSVNPKWEHRSFKDNCWYSFIQGEDKDDITDSGFLYPSKLRNELGIPSDRIVSYEKLFSLLEINSQLNVILVDDFVGTGAQTDKAWNVHKFGSSTLREIVKLNQHHVIYAPLVVNKVGYERILKNCDGLHLEYANMLDDKYSILNPDGLCWEGDRVKYKNFCKLLHDVAVKENIPMECGNNVNDMLGFGRQGLALAFNHGIPDACPAFFYWDTDTWKPLKKRPYHR